MTLTLQSFIENSIIPLAMFDRDMRYLAVSQSWIDTYEETDDVVGKLHYDLIPDLPEKWKAAHRDGLNGKTSHSNEEAFEFANGKSGWIRWQVSPWYNSDGSIGGIIILSDIITAKIEKEIELRNVLKRFELIQQAAKIGMWDWNISEQQIVLNAEYYEILGRNTKDSIGYDDFLNLIHSEDVSRVKDSMNAALNGGGKYCSEFRIYRENDGKLRWVKDQGNIEFNDNGMPVRAYGAIIDVTEQKLLSNDQLHKVGEDFHQFINSALEGIWVVDRNGVTTFVNAAITRMLGYSEEELIGKSMFTFSDPEWNKVAFEKFSERTYGKSERYKFQLRKKDGSRIWCLVSANPIVEDHQFIGTVTVITDFTEYMKTDIAKDKRIEELEKQLTDRV